MGLFAKRLDEQKWKKQKQGENIQKGWGESTIGSTRENKNHGKKKIDLARDLQKKIDGEVGEKFRGRFF